MGLFSGESIFTSINYKTLGPFSQVLLGELTLSRGDDDGGTGGALKYQAPKDPSRARAAASRPAPAQVRESTCTRIISGWILIDIVEARISLLRVEWSEYTHPVSILFACPNAHFIVDTVRRWFVCAFPILCGPAAWLCVSSGTSGERVLQRGVHSISSSSRCFDALYRLMFASLCPSRLFLVLNYLGTSSSSSRRRRSASGIA